MSKHVLILASCGKKGRWYGGFRFPNKGKVLAPRWEGKQSVYYQNVPGGLLWGEGDFLRSPVAGFDSHWLVIKAAEEDVVKCSTRGEVVFREGEIVYFGDRDGAVDYLLNHGARDKAVTWAKIHVSSNHDGAVGDFGRIFAERYCKLSAGYRGQIMAGDWSKAQAGDCGVVHVGNHGRAQTGKFGVSVSGSYGVSKSGEEGVSVSDDAGLAICGKNGCATVGSMGVAVGLGTGCRVTGGAGAIALIGPGSSGAVGPSGTAILGVGASAVIGGATGMFLADRGATISVEEKTFQTQWGSPHDTSGMLEAGVLYEITISGELIVCTKLPSNIEFTLRKICNANQEVLQAFPILQPYLNLNQKEEVTR